MRVTSPFAPKKPLRLPVTDAWYDEFRVGIPTESVLSAQVTVGLLHGFVATLAVWHGFLPGCVAKSVDAWQISLCQTHRAARLEGHLKEPIVYAVFTEAGSNNTSRIEYRHGRRVEVAARDWEVFTFGAHYEVIEKATGLAIHAHNGGVRFDASRTDTTPESYIRKYRATIDNTVSAHCSDLHSLVGLQLNIPYARQEGEVEHPWLSVLREHGRAADSAGGTQVSLTLGTGSPDLLASSREDDLRADVSVVAWLCGKLTATQWAHAPRGSLDHIGQLAKEREGYRRFNRRRA